MEEGKEFRIGGKKYRTQELTIEQDELLMDVLKDVLKDINLDKMIDTDVTVIFRAIAQKRLLRRALSIILIPVNSEFSAKKLKEVEHDMAKCSNSIALEALKDFLQLNAGWVDLLIDTFPQLPEVGKEMAKLAPETSDTAEPN